MREQPRAVPTALRLSTACLLPGLLAPALWGESSEVAPNVGWHHFGGDAANTKYSPLDQIDRSNFQAVRHGLWDYDLPPAPNLVDIEVGGRRIPAIAQVSKQGFTYVFDRRTGEPVWPIEDRPATAAPP